MDDEDLALLTIADVRVAVPAGNGIEAGLVVMREVDEPNREMRMIVGQPEARAIHVPWSSGVPPRPSTWDLFVSTLSVLDARVDHVVITDVQEGRHFFAQLVVHRAGIEEPLVLTARPSDAIALALRTWGTRIYARPHVLDEAGLLADGSNWVRPRAEPESPTAGVPRARGSSRAVSPRPASRASKATSTKATSTRAATARAAAKKAASETTGAARKATPAKKVTTAKKLANARKVATARKVAAAKTGTAAARTAAPSEAGTAGGTAAAKRRAAKGTAAKTMAGAEGTDEATTAVDGTPEVQPS